MKTSNYLLPYKFKKVGAVLFCLSVAFMIISKIYYGDLLNVRIPSLTGFGNNHFGINKVNLDFTVIIITTMLSLLFIALSKEKIEDECISEIRAKAFSLTLWIISILIILASIFVYEMPYLYVLIANIFGFLFLLTVIQSIMIFNFNKKNENEYE